MTGATNVQLNDAKRSKVTIRLQRGRFEPGVWIDGYVVDHSDKFLLIEEIDDRIRLDGFLILRPRDTTKFDIPNPRDVFYKSALRLRGERRNRRPRIELYNLPSVLDSVSKIWPLVVVYRESINRDTCYIGRIVELGARTFDLETIDIHAKLDGEIETFKYSDITRIDFGGGYESALALVAGLTTPSTSTKSIGKK